MDKTQPDHLRVVVPSKNSNRKLAGVVHVGICLCVVKTFRFWMRRISIQRVPKMSPTLFFLLHPSRAVLLELDWWKARFPRKVISEVLYNFCCPTLLALEVESSLYAEEAGPDRHRRVTC